MATSKINPSGTAKLDTQRILERGERIREGTDKPWDVLVQESSLYDHKPTMRFVLTVLARARVQGDGPNARPNHPSRKALPHGAYENWCWLNQESIASRVGCDDRYVRDCVNQFAVDDAIEIREWRDDLGHPHLEYKVNIQTVKLHRRKDGEPRAKRYTSSRKANAGSFSIANQPSHRNSQPLGIDDKTGVRTSACSQVHRNSEPSPTGTVSRKPPEPSTVTNRNSQPSATGTECRGLGVGFGLKVLDSSSGLLSQTPPNGGDGSLRSPSAFGGSNRASHEEQKAENPTPTPVRGSDPVSKPEEQNQKQHRDRCLADGCRGKQSPARTGFCSWHDRQRSDLGRKPRTFDQMPVKGVAGLGEEGDGLDLEAAKEFACEDCGLIDGHKPSCPSDPYARADADEVDVEICSECAVADARHSRDCSKYVERIPLWRSQANA